MKLIVSRKRLADIALLGMLFLGVRAYDAICFVISNMYSFFEAVSFMWLITVGISCIVVYLHDFCFEKYGWDLLDLQSINALRSEDISSYHPWRRLAKWAVVHGKVWIFLIFSWLTGPFVVALLLRPKRAWGHTVSLVAPASLLSALVWVSVWAGVGLLVWEDYFQPFFLQER